MPALGTAIAVPFRLNSAGGDAPFNPINEPDLNYWFDSKANVTVDGDQGVSQWVDLSPSAFTITQATANARPLLQPERTPNGSPVLTFDGINDFLRLTTPIAGTVFTSYLMLAIQSPIEGSHIYDGSSEPNFLYVDGANLNFKNLATRPRPATGEFFFAAIVQGAAGSILQINESVGAGALASWAWDGFTIGMSRANFNTANSNISVCAILQYAAEHDAPKRAEFLDFLTNRFLLPVVDKDFQFVDSGDFLFVDSSKLLFT